MITIAAAPSLIDEALAAVIVPSLAKAGFRLRDLVEASPLPGCSSSATVVGPLRPAISTGDDLAVEPAVLLRGLGAGQRGDGVIVLRLRG